MFAQTRNGFCCWGRAVEESNGTLDTDNHSDKSNNCTLTLSEVGQRTEEQHIYRAVCILLHYYYYTSRAFQTTNRRVLTASKLTAVTIVTSNLNFTR